MRDELELSSVAHKFQAATHENCAAIYSLRETSNLLNTVYIVVGALYLTQPENQANSTPVSLPPRQFSDAHPCA